MSVGLESYSRSKVNNHFAALPKGPTAYRVSALMRAAISHNARLAARELTFPVVLQGRGGAGEGRAAGRGGQGSPRRGGAWLGVCAVCGGAGQGAAGLGTLGGCSSGHRGDASDGSDNGGTATAGGGLALPPAFVSFTAGSRCTDKSACRVEQPVPPAKIRERLAFLWKLRFNRPIPPSVQSGRFPGNQKQAQILVPWHVEGLGVYISPEQAPECELRKDKRNTRGSKNREVKEKEETREGQKKEECERQNTENRVVFR